MLSTSWKATGLVQPIWNRLPVKTGKREELARLTGLQPTDLSRLNTGKRSMTMSLATRIAAAVPGVTVLDLGAPEEAADEPSLAMLSDLRRRLAEIEAALEQFGPDLAVLGGLPARVAALEQLAQPRNPRSGKRAAAR